MIELLDNLIRDKSDLLQGRHSSNSSKIASGFNELEKVDKSVGEVLQFTQEGLEKRNRSHLRPNLLEQRWAQLSADKPEEAISKLDELITDARGMISHAGDTSNLILDPDLDSYYTMDVTLLAVPQTLERISSLLPLALKTAHEQKLTEESKVQFAVFKAMFQESDLDRIVSSFETALNEEPSNFLWREYVTSGKWQRTSSSGSELPQAPSTTPGLLSCL